MEKIVFIAILIVVSGACHQKSTKDEHVDNEVIPSYFYASIKYPHLIHADTLCPSFKSFKSPYLIYSVSNPCKLDSKPVACEYCFYKNTKIDSIFNQWSLNVEISKTNDTVKRNAPKTPQKEHYHLKDKAPARSLLNDTIKN